jgi:Fe-S-cluster containining protein
MTESASKYAELEALYATLPQVQCQRKCFDYCGPILIPKIEAQRLEDKRGWLELVTIFEPSERPHLPDQEFIRQHFIGLAPSSREDLRCVFLSEMGSCMAYAIRPLVCRCFGCVDNEWLRCPHGCLPSPRWITEAEFKELNEKVVAIQRKYDA